mgnify:CR=1 FL=1
MAKKLNLVDMYGIGVMLEYLVAEDNLTCEERDRVILRIARENDIAEYMLSNLAGYGRSKFESTGTCPNSRPEQKSLFPKLYV